MGSAAAALGSPTGGGNVVQGNKQDQCARL
jgi:hypothetical protein